MPKRSTEADFWKRVEKQPNGCATWTGAKQSDGYGILTYQRKFWLSNRLAWTLAIGPIPDGLCVCHLCDNPSCCNPRHLFVGTHAQNMLDMKSKGRRKAINAGEKNGRAKLTANQADEIRKALAGGLTQMKVAAQFGVSQTLVSLIKRGQLWP
jgi:hypothetical protein